MRTYDEGSRRDGIGLTAVARASMRKAVGMMILRECVPPWWTEARTIHVMQHRVKNMP